jgi:hypothetical protein
LAFNSRELGLKNATVSAKEDLYGRLVSQFTGRTTSSGKTWNTVFASSGQAWGIPQDHITHLVNDETVAQTILDKVKSGERTTADVVLCNEVFKEMETEARFIKKYFLLMPPLTLTDLPTLLLLLPDDTHTPVLPPTGQPSLTITYPGYPHVLMVHLAPLPGMEPVVPTEPMTAGETTATPSTDVPKAYGFLA